MRAPRRSRWWSTKTDNSATYAPGGTGTYVVTVRNTGTSDALDVTVNDPLPVGVTLTGTVQCVGQRHRNLRHGHRQRGPDDVRDTGAGLGTGAGDSLVFTAPVAFASSLTDDPLVNTATATDLASGATAQRLRQRHAQRAVGGRDHQDRRQQRPTRRAVRARTPWSSSPTAGRPRRSP